MRIENKPLFLIFLAVMMFAVSCDKKSFTTDSTYAEEMESFIVDSEYGKELFTQNIYARGPFSLDDTLVKYVLTIDSVQRSMKVMIGSTPKDVPPYQSVYDAAARVDDMYFGRLSKVVGSAEEPSYLFVSNIVRIAYFLKLYGDAYEYRGWRFWAFSGANLARRVISESGTTFDAPALPRLSKNASAGQTLNIDNFLSADAIPSFELADSLSIISNNRDVISAANFLDSLAIFECRPQAQSYRADWKLASISGKFYNLITFQMPGELEIDSTIVPPETTLVRNADFIIPFKFDI